MEFFCYFMFAIYIFFLKKQTNYIIIFIIVGLILISIDIFGVSFSQLGRCIYSFFLGYSALRLNRFLIFPKKIMLSFFFLIIIFYLISTSLSYKFYFLPILFALFLCMIANEKKSLLKKILNISFLKFCGKISYSLYLTHFSIAYLLRQILHFVFKFEISNNMLKLDLFFLPIFLFYIFLVFIISNFLYKKIENQYRIK